MNKLLHSVAAMAVLGTPTLLLAQDERAINSGNISVSAGADFSDKYYFRGIVQVDNNGIVAQPWAQLDVALPSGQAYDLSLNVGIWNSVHSHHPADTLNDAWYESDVYAGIGMDIQNFSVGVLYTFYTSPANYFATVQEVALSLRYDDSGIWDTGEAEFALNPSLTLAVELDNSAYGPEEGMYLELGLAPSVKVSPGNVPVVLSIPVAVGLSLEDYYENNAGDDDEFGFGKVGVAVASDLSENILPAEYGTVSVTAGVSYLILGDALEGLNGDDSEILFNVGVGWAY